MSETNQPTFQVFTMKLDDYTILGHSFKNISYDKRINHCVILPQSIQHQITVWWELCIKVNKANS